MAPGIGPCVTSSSIAESRTLWVKAWATLNPAKPSALSCPSGTRARVGLRPNKPQLLAGIRIDPPLSVAWAAGSMPDATAQAEPPLDPPAERERSKGLTVGPNSMGEVQIFSPNSGVLVFPRITRPAAFKREINSPSLVGMVFAKARLPLVAGRPASIVFRSLTR